MFRLESIDIVHTITGHKAHGILISADDEPLLLTSRAEDLDPLAQAYYSKRPQLEDDAITGISGESDVATGIRLMAAIVGMYLEHENRSWDDLDMLCRKIISNLKGAI